jgi:hypothetical protein
MVLVPMGIRALVCMYKWESNSSSIIVLLYKSHLKTYYYRSRLKDHHLIERAIEYVKIEQKILMIIILAEMKEGVN